MQQKEKTYTNKELLNRFSGKGVMIAPERERVDFGKIIGYYVDKTTGIKYPTTMGLIHYSKKGSHIVPAKPKNYKGD